MKGRGVRWLNDSFLQSAVEVRCALTGEKGGVRVLNETAVLGLCCSVIGVGWYQRIVGCVEYCMSVYDLIRVKMRGLRAGKAYGGVWWVVGNALCSLLRDIWEGNYVGSMTLIHEACACAVESGLRKF